MAMLMGMSVLMIMAVPMMTVTMIMAMVMTMVMTQQQRADQVDGQADHRDQRCFPELHQHRLEEAQDGFDQDEQRGHAEQQGGREARQVAHLARAEGEAGIAGMALGIAVGRRRHRQRAGMGRHVEPIGQQGHRPGDPAESDLDHHGHRGQPYDPQRPPRILVMPGAEVDMVEIMAFLLVFIDGRGGEGARWRMVSVVTVPVMMVAMVVHRHFPYRRISASISSDAACRSASVRPGRAT